ncbi:hypothetical protein JAAARDRAFT_63810 [Jaapia argillacea MUCL 33604]|uniref:Glycoside hydrolase 131 catalytic N-terminal domain-containing protein n=1 Tax=Jaapia argillacea MUCL 33604 TaxID=933084 RepID=A0A067PFH7_9AGAM|nr:hypothetical protein JAAARDRAFT_63810 [Jaapia argillacea MUCL 33604]
MSFLFLLVALFVLAEATPILYDGRAPFNLTNSDLNTSTGPYLTVVKGSQNATHYSTLLGHLVPPTPLWNQWGVPTEQTISITIDNSSVFVPGGGAPQYGFRRTEFLAQGPAGHTALIPEIEVNTTVFHFSVQTDPAKPLNYTHEYQVVFIEPNDGTHVFELQLGSPYTNPTGTLPAPNAHALKIRDHALNLLFSTTFIPFTWHNFAIQVDWTNRTLAVLYSQDDAPLKAVTDVLPNLSATAGTAGQGDFHFGVLKLPLVNPADSTADQGDVVHYGIQEGTTEGLLYSGVFVESVADGISAGGGSFRPVGTSAPPLPSISE